MRESNDLVISATVQAMKEKLVQNDHKPDLPGVGLKQAIKRMNMELRELDDELIKFEHDAERTVENLEAIRLELADVINFAGAAVYDLDCWIYNETVLKRNWTVDDSWKF